MKVIKVGDTEIKLKNNLVTQSLNRWDLSNFKVKEKGKLYICNIACPVCAAYDCVSGVFGTPNSTIGSCPLYPCPVNMRKLLKTKKLAFYIDDKVVYYTNLKKKEAETQIKAIHSALEKAKEV